MSYHLISDNFFFLYGADELLRKHYGMRSVVFTSLIKEQNDKQLLKLINQKCSKKVIIYISNILIRRKILCILGQKNSEILILSHSNFFRKNQCETHDARVSVISTRASKAFFISCSRISGTGKECYVPNKTELDVIRTLSQGVSVPHLSEQLGRSAKTVYNIKNNTLERVGGLTGAHGLLLCRDIFEMQA